MASIIKLRETAAMINQFQYDRLTGLYSKEFFYQKVKEQLQKDPAQEYTIVCTNIENFKLYNDNFGVAAGDSFLQKMARLLREKSGEDAICGRFGADRFLCLQKREQEQKDRILISEDYTPAIKNVVIKWGIYEITDRTVPVEQMCDRALLAVDSIKGQYNRHFALYDDELRGKLLREKAITDAMETALDEGQFVVYFQPKYSLNTESLAGFIPRLDQYVWEQVCVRLGDWKKKGYSLLPVSVNVSRADVYQSHLEDVLLKLTQKYGVDPAYLHLEITESAYAENPNQIISTVEELRKLGFTIEMDDFGSGYSSLNMLSQMKLDILKLDMKFIQNEMAKSAEQSILNDVITMAHRMHLSVVAEGVETWEQAERLKRVDCDYVQGYFFAKPMPAAESEEVLKIQSPRCLLPLEQIAQKEINMHRLLLADEDAGYRKRVREAFEGQYQVLETSDASGALDCIKSAG